MRSWAPRLTPSFAEFAIADPANLIKKPAAINWEVAGSVAGAGGTAYAVLNKLGVHATDTLLIHAAAGGVGTFAVQLAVARGARVIGTASEPNFDYLRSMGAEPVAYGDGLRERVRAIAPRGVDAVLLIGPSLSTRAPAPTPTRRHAHKRSH